MRQDRDSATIIAIITMARKGYSVTFGVCSMLKRIKIKKSFLFPNGTILSNSYGIIRKMVGIMMTQNELRSIQSRGDVLLIRPGRDDIDYYDFKKMDIMINE